MARACNVSAVAYINNLNNNLKNEKDTHLQTKEELSKLKTKFEGIKSLFS